MLAFSQGKDIVEIMNRGTINNLLRKELTESNVSRYRISQETGINESILSRLLGGSSISSTTASKLLTYFGYEITKSKKEN